MSQENVERIIGDAVAALNREDWDAALKDATPGFVFDTSRTLGEWRGVHRGAYDVKRTWRSFAAPWISVRRDVDELIEGEGAAVTRMSLYFEGRDGIEVKISADWVWKFHEGAVTQITVYNDLGEALEAAGLRE
jgi:ketosteroid isomerase-like protein